MKVSENVLLDVVSVDEHSKIKTSEFPLFPLKFVDIVTFLTTSSYSTVLNSKCVSL